MKKQVVSFLTHLAYFTGTQEECEQWIKDYVPTAFEFVVLEYNSGRKLGDINKFY